MPLDNIDKQIIQALLNKGRESFNKLKDLTFKSGIEHMSHTGIRKRVAKLKDSEIMNIQGNLNLNKLQYYFAFIFLELEDYEKVKEIIEAYSDCPRTFLLTQVTGQFNLIVGVTGKNIDVLHTYLNHCGPTNKKGVLHSEILFTSNIQIPKFLPINLFTNISQEHKCGNRCKKCEAFLCGDCNGCGNF